MSAALDQFIEDARAVTVADAAVALGLKFLGRRAEHPQPCPACGGRDTFAFNTTKNKWNCRHGGAGGGDAIGMAAHVLGLDVKRREGFLEACAAVTGQTIPHGGEREGDDERAARLQRLDEQRARNAEIAAARDADQADFRERERDKARGIYLGGSMAAKHESGRLVGDYLRARGCGFPGDRWIRFSQRQPFWHGQDERGPIALHEGPAMLVPFLGADGAIIGCHITWIDLDQPPKFRPRLVDPATGEALPTKKMRGSKKGGVLPLCGRMDAERWLGAEGIENTLAFARWEGFRADTFYFAAGDIGNLCGRADPKSRFAHPDLTKEDAKGRMRPVMVAGPVPLVDGEADCMVVPDHVRELVLLADSDSERVMTASAMARAKARHARPGRLIPVVWPKPGTDFAAMMAGHEGAAR